MTPEYTYFLAGTQVYPSGKWGLDIARADEDFLFCRDYRVKFSGTLKFQGTDYDFIKLQDCCDELLFEIYCDGVLYWVGYFSYPNGLEFDDDSCNVSGTPGTKDKYYPFDISADDNQVDYYNYQDFTWEAANINSDNWTATRSYGTLLWDIVGYYVRQILGAGESPVSTFFENDTFPDATNPYPVINYVTGYDNKLNHLLFAMTKHVHSGNGFNPPYPEISWNEWMEILHNTFNVWWYVDEAGNVRIEHIYFWELYFGNSYDLTTLNNGRWIVNTNKYRYADESLPQRELWNWRDELLDHVDFLEQLIGYDCSYRNEYFHEREYSLTSLTTDLEFIAQNWVGHVATTEIEDSDYMFLRTVDFTDYTWVGGDSPDGNNRPNLLLLVPAPDYVCWYSQGARSGNNHLNAHLSASNLHVNYWMHDRPFWEGTMIGEDTNFDSVLKNKIQTDFSFPTCCIGEATEVSFDLYSQLYQMGIDWNEFIVTQYGGGEIYTGTLTPDGMFRVELIYENDCIDEESATEWSDASEL